MKSKAELMTMREEYEEGNLLGDPYAPTILSLIDDLLALRQPPADVAEDAAADGGGVMSNKLKDEQLRSMIPSHDVILPTAVESMATEILALRALSSESVAWLDAALGMVERGDGPPNWDGIREHLLDLRAALSVQP
jgi:hypothetical protein